MKGAVGAERQGGGTESGIAKHGWKESRKQEWEMRNRWRKKGTEGGRDEEEKAEEGTIRVKMNGELGTSGLRASKKLKRWLRTITLAPSSRCSATPLLRWHKESRVERTWPHSGGSWRPEDLKDFWDVPFCCPAIFLFLSRLFHPSVVTPHGSRPPFNTSFYLISNQIHFNRQKRHNGMGGGEDSKNSWNTRVTFLWLCQESVQSLAPVVTMG